MLLNDIVFFAHPLQIAREMVISPRNPRLGLTALTKRIGLIERPDNPDGELIKYKVISLFYLELLKSDFTRSFAHTVITFVKFILPGLLILLHLVNIIVGRSSCDSC